MNNAIIALREQIAQLKAAHDAGELPQARYAQEKTALEQRLLALVLSDTGAPAQAAPDLHTKPARPSAALLCTLVLGIVLFAAAGYWWKSGSAFVRMQADAAEQASAQASGSGEPSAQQVASMADKLAEHLKAQPDDGEGWSMLARTYNMLSRNKEALGAYEKALALRGRDAELIADYADTLAVVNGGSLEGAPMVQVERALRVDPKNLKALALAGSYRFNKKDYKGAVKFWELLVQTGPADNLFVKAIAPGLLEARKRAGMPDDAAPAHAQAPAKASVEGTVTLAAALSAQFKPDDTVFVFARAENGPRMPLAILRKQVRDLPLHFTLDDSLAMSPSNALSSARSVVVEARVSKSGNAMPQPGDFYGQSAPVAVGSTGLQIDIRDSVSR